MANALAVAVDDCCDFDDMQQSPRPGTTVRPNDPPDTPVLHIPNPFTTYPYIPPSYRHLVKFTYLAPLAPDFRLAHSRCLGAGYMSSRYMSQLLVCHMILWSHCDSL